MQLRLFDVLYVGLSPPTLVRYIVSSESYVYLFLYMLLYLVRVPKAHPAPRRLARRDLL